MGYKYDLLDRKYARKEKKNDIRLFAVKITNETDRDLFFGKDIMLASENGMGLLVLEEEKVFGSLRQKPATHLFYLLLSPIVVTTYTSDPYEYTRFRNLPVGFVAGAGLTGFNLIKASSANKKFKRNLETFRLNGKTIPGGESIYGLVGVRADNYDALQIRILHLDDSLGPDITRR